MRPVALLAPKDARGAAVGCAAGRWPPCRWSARGGGDGGRGGERRGRRAAVALERRHEPARAHSLAEGVGEGLALVELRETELLEETQERWPVRGAGRGGVGRGGGRH